MAGSMLALELARPDGPRLVPLVDGLTVGRDPSCDLVITGSLVSRHQCRFEERASGFVLVDLQSRNGTQVNRKRVDSTTIELGDVIAFGEVLATVVAFEPSTAMPAGERAPDVAIAVGTERFPIERTPHDETDWPERPPGDLGAHLDALYDGALLAMNAVSSEEVLAALLETVARTFGCASVELWMTDRDGMARPRESAPCERELAFDAMRGLVHRATMRDERALATALLRTSHGVIGAVVAIRPDAAFTLGELQVLVACAHQAALGVEAAERRAALTAENERLKARVGAHRLAGTSTAMDDVRRAITRAAKSDATVLIVGESGTGKELAAEAIHTESARGKGPFVAVNCGAIASTLLEAELFGHERGAFTGADVARAGFIERAAGGSLFLDEVGELPLGAQAALLRVIERKALTRVGGVREIAVDFRVIAATHRDLRELVSRGAMREDFYYRLRVLEIAMPALRDRLDDLPSLAARFFTERPGPAPRLGDDALERLRSHSWPGNVRELWNVLERARMHAEGDHIRADDLGELEHRTPGDARMLTLREIEAEHVQRVLDSVEWNKARAAEILGIGRPTVYEKIRAYGLSPRRR